MSSGRPAGNDSGYRPTSLDFINRPNPVEPHSHGSLAQDNRQLGRTIDEELLRVLSGQRSRDTAVELSRNLKFGGSQPQAHSLAAVLNEDNEPSRAHPHNLTVPNRDIDSAIYTLPELPVRRGVKRPRNRVPPVLQGLHQPPPDAGLLPSINVHDSHSRSLASGEQSNAIAEKLQGSSSTNSETTSAPKAPPKRNWTTEETNDLLEGVNRFGVGNWKQILNCRDFKFNKRNTVDLKDRFRVWTRHQAKRDKSSSVAASSDSISNVTGTNHNPATISLDDRGSTNMSSFEPHDFVASKRRKRNKWTEEQDLAIERGFQQYGNSWSSIQQDPALKERTATDIRDRFRIKFPAEYKEKGLAPKQPRLTIRPDEESDPTVPPSSHQGSSEQSSSVFPSTLDDTWLTDLQLASEEDDSSAIVLDRSIVDWANRQLPSLPSILAAPNDDRNFELQGVDPRATLLPRPPI